MAHTIVVKDQLGVVRSYAFDSIHDKIKMACSAVDAIRDWFMIAGEAHDIYTDEERDRYAEECRQAMIDLRTGRLVVRDAFFEVADFVFSLEL